jgi:sugar phosphate permease
VRRNDARAPATYRWVILAVLWLTLLVSYFDRVAIAAAPPFMSIDLRLSPTEMGLVSGALLLSYTLVQVPEVGTWLGLVKMVAS